MPLGDGTLDRERLDELLGEGFTVHDFGGWLLVEGTGPVRRTSAMCSS